MKIFLVHGVGHQERPGNEQWKQQWEDAITAGLQYFDRGVTPSFDYLNYDELFSGKINLLSDVGGGAPRFRAARSGHRRRR